MLLKKQESIGFLANPELNIWAAMVKTSGIKNLCNSNYNLNPFTKCPPYGKSADARTLIENFLFLHKISYKYSAQQNSEEDTICQGRASKMT